MNEPDFVEKLGVLHKKKPEFRTNWLVGTIMTNHGAGGETLGVTVSSLLEFVASRPKVQAKIHEEIDLARKEGRLSEPPKLGELERELPFLQACLQESARLHPVVGVSLLRVVPEGGLEAEGHFLPAGVS